MLETQEKKFVCLNTKIQTNWVWRKKILQYPIVGAGDQCNIPIVSLLCSCLLPTSLTIPNLSSLLVVSQGLKYKRCCWDKMLDVLILTMLSSRQHERVSILKITSALLSLRLKLNSWWINNVTSQSETYKQSTEVFHQATYLMVLCLHAHHML